MTMKEVVVLACCAALIGSISTASAQTTGRKMDHSMMSGDRMNANDRMMKRHSVKKHHAMHSGMKGDMDRGGMKKGM